MEIIHLRQTLPQVFADRDAITSDVWHQDLVLRKGEHYRKTDGRYSYIYTDIAAITKVLSTLMNAISARSPFMSG